MELDRLFSTSRREEAARFDLAATRADLEVERRRLAIEVCRAYDRLVDSRGRATLARVNVGRRRYLELFLRYVGPEWRRALLLAVLLLITIGLQLLNPQLLRRFIDSALAGSDVSSLVTIALLFMAIAFVTQVLDAFSRFDIPYRSGVTSNDMIPDNTTVELFVSHKP